MTKSGGAITPLLLLRFQSGPYGPVALGNTSLLLLFDSFLCMIQLIDFFSCYSQGVGKIGSINKYHGPIEMCYFSYFELQNKSNVKFRFSKEATQFERFDVY